MASSFAPKDFGTGRWQGGPATISEPRFEYRKFTPEKGENAGKEVKVTTAYVEYLDESGGKHKAQFDVANAEYCQIKESADDGADEATVGPAYAHPDPKKTFKLSPDSDFAKFVQNLVLYGFPESKLEAGDITVLDGLEVDVKPVPRKDGDKFPLLLPVAVRLKAGAKSAAKVASSAGAGAANDAATETVLEAIIEAGGAGNVVPQATVVKKAMTKFKGQDVKAAAVALLSNAAWLNNSDQWIYNASDKTITGV